MACNFHAPAQSGNVIKTNEGKGTTKPPFLSANLSTECNLFFSIGTVIIKQPHFMDGDTSCQCHNNAWIGTAQDCAPFKIFYPNNFSFVFQTQV